MGANIESKALRFITDNPGCQAADLAEYLWPDSVMHRKVSNQGHGGCRGKAAWLCGGSLAGKLVKRGLVRREYLPVRYYATMQGRKD